jgi:hypothetical protein
MDQRGVSFGSVFFGRKENELVQEGETINSG